MTYSLQAEHKTHFEVSHPKEGVFKVAKSHLDDKTIEKIRKMPKAMAEGGEVGGDSADSQADEAIEPATEPQQVGGETPSAPVNIPNMKLTGMGLVNADTAPPAPAAAAPQPEKAPERQPNPNEGPAGGMQTVGLGTPQGPVGMPPMDNYGAEFGQTAGAIRAKAKAETEAEKQINNAVLEQQKNLKIAQDTYTASIAENEAQHQNIVKSIQDQKIDPNRVWNNMSTGNTVMAAIGMILSGIGSGLTGQPNMAMQVIEKTIDRDIDAQKAELGKKETLLSENMRKYGNINHAYQMTASQLNSVVQGQIMAISAKTQGAVAQQNAQIALAELSMKQKQLNMQLAYQRANFNVYAGGSGGGAGPTGGVDPNRIRAGLAAGVIPEKAADKMTDEYGKYTKLQKDIANVKDTFAHISSLQTWGNRLGTPDAMAQAKNQIESATDYSAAGLAKDEAGRVTEVDLPIYKKMHPQFVDSPETIAKKQDQLIDSLIAKTNLPAMRQYGIISPNDPTMMTSSQRRANDNRNVPVRGGATSVLTGGK